MQHCFHKHLLGETLCAQRKGDGEDQGLLHGKSKARLSTGTMNMIFIVPVEERALDFPCKRPGMESKTIRHRPSLITMNHTN